MSTARPAVRRVAADQIVVSVGPYMFHNEALRWSRGSARSWFQASPPQRILSFGCPFQPAASNKRQVAGVACITVAPERASKRSSLLPSEGDSRLATTTRAPLLNGSDNSQAP